MDIPRSVRVALKNKSRISPSSTPTTNLDEPMNIPDPGAGPAQADSAPPASAQPSQKIVGAINLNKDGIGGPIPVNEVERAELAAAAIRVQQARARAAEAEAATKENEVPLRTQELEQSIATHKSQQRANAGKALLTFGGVALMLAALVFSVKAAAAGDPGPKANP